MPRSWTFNRDLQGTASGIRPIYSREWAKAQKPLSLTFVEPGFRCVLPTELSRPIQGANPFGNAGQDPMLMCQETGQRSFGADHLELPSDKRRKWPNYRVTRRRVEGPLDLRLKLCRRTSKDHRLRICNSELTEPSRTCCCGFQCPAETHEGWIQVGH